MHADCEIYKIYNLQFHPQHEQKEFCKATITAEMHGENRPNYPNLMFEPFLQVGQKIEVQVEIHRVPTKASCSMHSTSTLFKPLHGENSVKLARVHQQLAEQIEVLEDQGAVKRKLKKV